MEIFLDRRLIEPIRFTQFTPGLVLASVIRPTMNNFAQLSDSRATFLVRWRGRQEGPYLASVIEAKLAANEIGLQHEIFYDGKWVAIQDYIRQKESPRYVTSHCRHCDGGIEFDANQLDAAEDTTVPCPHCGLETKIFVPEQKEPPVISDESVVEPAEKQPSNPDVCHEQGDGAAQDCVEAYKRMKLAAAQGSEGAQKKCEELVLKMNAAQVEAVEPKDQILWKRDRLMPKQFSDFVGQERAKARLEIAVVAAKSKGEALGHVLLIGSPRSGRATLASLLARVMGVNLKSTSGYAVETAGDLASLLTNLEAGDVLFIDEIHHLRTNLAEYLAPALKDFQLDSVIDLGPNARPVHLDLPRFTLIGSTTNEKRLTPDFLSCFRIVEKLDAYSVDELAAIARRFATSMEVEIEAAAADGIGRSADGTPIDVLNRLQRVRDFAHVKGKKTITPEVANTALKTLALHHEKQAAGESRAAIPSEVRREVWRRDCGLCVKCGSRKNLEYAHVIPVSKGGSNTVRNIELLCGDCNRSKRDSIQ